MVSDLLKRFSEALRELLCGFPEKIPPVLIAQHIPGGFSTALAMRFNEMFPFAVKESKHGEMIESNTVYISPGGKLMSVQQMSLGKIMIHVSEDTENKYLHKPSVDHLFLSVAKENLRNVIAVVLTGMGKDGAIGIKKLHELGASTIAQSENTCVVFGMPKAAIQTGCIDHVVDLQSIAQKISDLSFKK